MEKEARKYIWEGAIPLQIHLHESEVTTLPPPPSALILAPRIGYLPLLVPLIKPHFSSALPPGVDTVWFEYKGLPLKCFEYTVKDQQDSLLAERQLGPSETPYIPTGVLFDLLCAEPERPWNLTVHFRGYPGNILIPCEGEESIKWSFINSLKEAAYITNGNCKNVMNMSQSDQLELWRSVMNGNMEAYIRVSSKLKLGTVEDEYTVRTSLYPSQSRQGPVETDLAGQVKTGRIPVRLYVWSVSDDFGDFEDFPEIDSWDKISYINRPVEIHREGKCFTLRDAIKTLLPEFFGDKPLINGESTKVEGEDEQKASTEEVSSKISGKDGEENSVEQVEPSCSYNNAEIKLIRIQGIEPKWEIPFSWVVNNLMNPEYFLHICVCIKVPQVNIT